MPSTRLLGSLCLVVLVALAGCGSVGDGQNAREPFSVEPTADDEQTDTTTEPTVVPSTFEPDPANDSIGDPEAILPAQREVLYRTSYQVESRQLVVAENGTALYEFSSHNWFTENRSRFASSIRRGGANYPASLRSNVFADGERVYLWQTRGNNTTKKVMRGSDGTPVPPRANSVGLPRGEDSVWTVPQFLTLVNITSVEKLDDAPEGLDGAFYRIEGERATAGNSTSNRTIVGNATDVQVSATVSERGFVYEFTATYNTTLNGESARINRALRYHDIGQTDLSQPDWVDEIKQNETTTGATTTSTAPTTGTSTSQPNGTTTGDELDEESALTASAIQSPNVEAPAVLTADDGHTRRAGPRRPSLACGLWLPRGNR
ncbi:hypothetical protein [Haloarchaeobius sp. DFWS5]|uniref:hypothetical protein n=1 Tax=Haloarchaeobius sp. DFWS5 TaxID=3446114 RepID=UPI003EBB36E5